MAPYEALVLARPLDRSRLAVCKKFFGACAYNVHDAPGPGNPGVAATSVPFRGREDGVQASKLQDLPPY